MIHLTPGCRVSIQLPIATAAIDGKNVATLRWHDLCRVLELDPKIARSKQVKKLLKKKFPNVQLCIPTDGMPYALARVNTVTLISSKAAVCIYQRPIEGRTNEIGALPALLKELRKAYGRTDIVAMLTTDAGNTSLGTATQIVDELHWDYFSQFKSEHGELHKEAVRLLGRRGESTADATYNDTQNGYVVTYHVWHADLSEHGWLDWNHARQLIRVQRVAEHPTTGHKTVGNRYYVTSKTSSELEPTDALTISRGHWRCEEETHWTADVVLQEDRRRLAWSRHPHGVFVISLLRRVAQNILAVARKLSRVRGTNQQPTWEEVTEHFLLRWQLTILPASRRFLSPTASTARRRHSWPAGDLSWVRRQNRRGRPVRDVRFLGIRGAPDGDQDSRWCTEKAVWRTAPMSCIVHDLFVLWYEVNITKRRSGGWLSVPWYRRKTKPSFSDMLTAARRGGWRLYVSDLPSGTRCRRKPLINWHEAVWATA